MDTNLPAKSILKQNSATPSRPTLSDEQKARADRDRRNLGIALHHANKIQDQKNVQAQILSTIETLLDYPSTPTPTSTEAAKFAELVKPFQPSDFDDLVEERRIDGKCAYVLCSNPPRSATLGESAAWKLKGKAFGDFCGKECVRKALYVKAQLSEVPAWERVPGQDVEVVLSEHAPHGRATGQGSSDVKERVANERELAQERGESAASLRPGSVMTERVVEKASVAPSSTTPLAGSHMAIEGYEPAHGNDSGAKFPRTEDEEDMSGPAHSQIPKHGNGDIDDEETSWRDLYSNMKDR